MAYASALFANSQNSYIPKDYVTPTFPSLYWPFPINGPQALYLYRISDVWRFTTLWTLITYGALYGSSAIYAVLMQWRAWKIIWVVPVLYVVIGGVEAIMAGSVVGALLGTVYNSGHFTISTWIPFIWGCINALVILLSSFAMQGGL